MKKIDKLLNLFRKTDEKQKTISKITSMSFKQSDTDYDGYFLSPSLKGYFKVESILPTGETEKFTIIVTTNFLLSLDVKMYSEYGDEIKNVKICSTIKPINAYNFYLDFERIDSQNPKYKGYGFGRLMMEAMFHYLGHFSKINNLNFQFLSGTIGTNANDTPEKSIPLYLSFDNFNFDNNLIIVDKTTLNAKDRNIYFEIVKETV